MLKLSKRLEYALISLVHVGRLSDGEVASTREIAEAYLIPPELLGKVLQRLGRAGLIRSSQGARGGYQLARPLAEISLGELIAAIEGPVNVVPCVGDQDCPQACTCTIRSPVFSFQDRLLHFLHSISVAALVSEDWDPKRIQEHYPWLTKTHPAT